MGCCGGNILQKYMQIASKQATAMFTQLAFFNNRLTQQQKTNALKIWAYPFLKGLQTYFGQQFNGSKLPQIIKTKSQLEQILTEIVKQISQHQKINKYFLQRHKKQKFVQKSNKAQFDKKKQHHNDLNDPGLDNDLNEPMLNYEKIGLERKESNRKSHATYSHVSRVSDQANIQMKAFPPSPYSMPISALQIQEQFQQSSSLKTQILHEEKYDISHLNEIKQQRNINYTDKSSRNNQNQLNSISKTQQSKKSSKIHENKQLKAQLQQALNKIYRLQINIKSLQGSINQQLSQKYKIQQEYKTLQLKMKQMEKRLKDNQIMKSFIYAGDIKMEPIQGEQLINDKKENIYASNGNNRDQKDYQIIFNLFPYSKILPNHENFQSAIGIRTIISEFFTEKIKKTTLVYSYDEITITHFDKYIQNKENLLVLIMLKNDYIIGAFAGKFQQNDQLSQSFLFSINPKTQPIIATTKNKIKRINLQNNSYLNFGNGELRLKAKTLDMSCNIGNFNSIYSWGKKNVPFDKFLGGQSRSCSIRTYQIHEIAFLDKIQYSK